MAGRVQNATNVAMRLGVPNCDKGKTVGIAGLIALLVLWAVLLFPWRILPSRCLPRLDPPLVILVLTILAGSATVAGIVAGRMSSKWWFFLGGAAVLSLALLLASVAV